MEETNERVAAGPVNFTNGYWKACDFVGALENISCIHTVPIGVSIVNNNWIYRSTEILSM